MRRQSLQEDFPRLGMSSNHFSTSLFAEKIFLLMLTDSILQNRYTMMWPWRVQTTEGATGSAFAIAFANSYGQIGSAVGSQLFNSRYAPRYTTSFGIAMGFLGAAIIMNIITWAATWRVDVDTRRLKRARIAAAKRNEALLDDVDIHAGEKSRVD